MSRISFSEQALSVTNANSVIFGGYISSTLAAMNRHVTPVTIYTMIIYKPQKTNRNTFRITKEIQIRINVEDVLREIRR
jgi:uracil-DNA glycosylase